ncbi:MAG TPA: Fic family protein [Conexibacter sp.]|nr:Fic family protein [Conexibacter sp.]
MSEFSRRADERVPSGNVPGFDGLRDERNAPFYLSRMPRIRTPDETAQEVARSFAKVVHDFLTIAGQQPIRLTPEHLERMHRGIFRTTFPERAGRFRDDDVTYGALWREDGVQQRRLMDGLPAEEVPPALNAAFAPYTEELRRCAPAQRTTAQATAVAVSLYAEILRIHPFPDGNTRTSFPLLQGALRSLGGLPCHFAGAEPQRREALGWAVQPDPARRTVEPLVAFVRERMKTSPLVLTRMEG